MFIEFVRMKIDVLDLIKRFHSRHPQPCKFIGTKESFYIKKG